MKTDKKQLKKNELYFIQQYREFSQTYKVVFNLMFTALVFLDKENRENKRCDNGNQ